MSAALDRVRDLDTMYVEQKLAPIVNRYRVSTVGPDGKSPAELIAFVQQKRMKIREQIEFFADESRTEVILRLKSRKILEIRGRADVLLPSGEAIGSLQKVFGKSLLRSTWEIYDANNQLVATGQESSMAMAVLRRVWGFIPYLGDIPFFIPFHFDILIGDRPVGHYHRMTPSLRDRYVLDLRGDTDRRIDRRVALALTIALDALQDR